MFTTTKKLCLAALALVLGFTACNPDLDNLFKSKLAQELTFPVTFGKANIFDLITNKDDSTFKQNADQSLFINLEQPLIDLNLDGLSKVTEVSIKQALVTTLGGIGQNNTQAGPFNATNAYSFGEFLANAPERDAIYAMNGGIPVDNIPAITTNTTGMKNVIYTPMLPGGFYNSATLSLTITNGFPVAVTGLTMFFYEPNTNAELFNVAIGNASNVTPTTATFTLNNKVILPAMKVAYRYMSNATVGNVDTTTDIMVLTTFTNLTQSSTSSVPLSADISNNVVSDNVKFVELLMAGGTAEISVQNKLDFDYKGLNIKFQSLTLNGDTTNVNLPIIKAGTTETRTFDLSGGKFNLRGADGTRTNTLFGLISVDSTNAGTVGAGDSLILTIRITQPNIRRAQGNFGSQAMDYPNTKTILSNDFFNHIISGTINIKNTSATLSVENTSGIGSMAILKSTTTNGQNGNKVSLTPNPEVTLLRAIEVNNNPENDPANGFQINSSNSNIDNYFSNLPKEFNTSGEVKDVDPPTDFTQFVYNNSSIKAILKAKIELNAAFDNFKLTDTLNFDLSNEISRVPTFEITDGVEAEVLNLIPRVDNGFPADIRFSAVILDSMNNPVDTLISETPIAAGALDNNGRVTSPRRTYFNPIAITKARFDRLAEGRKCVIIATANSPLDANGNQFYKIFSDYSVEFKLIANIKINTELGN